MSHKKHNRKIERQKEKEESRKKKFLDACALRLPHCHREIAAMDHTSIVAVTSYFSFGEAVGSAVVDELQGEVDPGANYLFGLLLDQIGKGNLRLVSAESATSTFDGIRGKYLREENIPDTHHMAMAISHGCFAIVSADQDICGISNDDKREIRRIYNLEIESRHNIET